MTQDELPSDVRQFFADAAPPPLDPALEGRLRARIDATLARPPAPALPSWLRGGGLVAVGLAAGIAADRLWLAQTDAPAPTAAQVAAPRPAAPPEPALAPERLAPAPARPPARPAPAVPSRAAVEAPAPPLAKPAEQPPATPVGGRDLDLAEERTLVEIARTSLSRGDLAQAERSLAEHERRFPQGALVEERELLAVRTLRGLGQTEKARQRAGRFAERFPGSALLSAVRALADAP